MRSEGAAGQCNVYLARLAALCDDSADLLDDHERSRAARYRLADDRARFVLGAVLLRTAAGHALGVPTASIALDRTCDQCGEPHGRPRVVDADLHVSVSHSGEVVGVAVTSAGRVGVDVEAVITRTGDDYDDIRTSVCTADEQRFATGDAFFTYWTRKEAVLKATGRGLLVAMTDISITSPDQQPRLVSFAGGAPPPCRMSDLDAGVGYRGAVAVLTPEPVDFVVLDSAPLLRAACTT